MRHNGSLRARMAVNRQTVFENGRGIWTHTTENLKVANIFRGLGPTLVGVVPYAGISFGTFETLKALTLSQQGKISVTNTLTYGAIAGLVAQTTTYPLDTIRRRMQADGVVEEPNKYTSIRKTVKEILKAEGKRGFFKGVTMNWVKGPIAISISFTAFDALKNQFNIKPLQQH